MVDNFFEKLVSNIGKKGSSHMPEASEEYTKMLKERDEIKSNIRTNLERLHFTKGEISEVFGIIDFSYKQIEDIKKSLIGSNINNEFDQMEKQMKKAQTDIKKITNMMVANLNQKVQQIRAQKGDL